LTVYLPGRIGPVTSPRMLSQLFPSSRIPSGYSARVRASACTCGCRNAKWCFYDEIKYVGGVFDASASESNVPAQAP
jgi:hypothetical protein